MLLDRYFSVLDKATEYMQNICVGIFFVAFILVNLRFITRLAGISTPWINELTLWSVVLIIFFFGGFLIWKDEHLQVEILSQRLSFKMRYILRICQLLLILIVCAILVVWGYEYAQVGQNRQALTLPITMFWPYMIIPIGAVLMTILTISKITQLLTYPEKLVEDYESRYGQVTDDEQDNEKVENMTNLEETHE